MNKQRLESFSDGVFSIVVTLLIFTIKLPDVDSRHLAAALYALLPSLTAYVLSFLLIGMYWVFHHHSFLYIEKVDGVLLWMNILYLLCISFLPFPTLLMGKYYGESLPAVIYGINLLIINIFPVLLIFYLKRNATLTTRAFAEFKNHLKVHKIIYPLYMLSVVIAFYIPKISLGIYLIVAILLISYSLLVSGMGNLSPHNHKKTESHSDQINYD